MKGSLAFASKSYSPSTPSTTSVIDSQVSEVEIVIFYDYVLGQRHPCISIHCHGVSRQHTAGTTDKHTVHSQGESIIDTREICHYGSVVSNFTQYLVTNITYLLACRARWGSCSRAASLLQTLSRRQFQAILRSIQRRSIDDVKMLAQCKTAPSRKILDSVNAAAQITQRANIPLFVCMLSILLRSGWLLVCLCVSGVIYK